VPIPLPPLAERLAPTLEPLDVQLHLLERPRGRDDAVSLLLDVEDDDAIRAPEGRRVGRRKS